MASSFAEAFSKSFQAEMARRRDVEAEIEREKRLEERAGRERTARVAEAIESEARQNKAALQLFKEQGQFRAQEAADLRDVLKSERIADIASSVPYNQPFDFSGSLEAAENQMKEYEKIQAHEKERAIYGLKPRIAPAPQYITREIPGETEGQVVEIGEIVTPGITPISPAEEAEVAEAKRAKLFADTQSETFRAARAKRSSDAMDRDANASAALESLPQQLKSEVIQEYNSLVPKNERGEAVGAPQVGVLAALVSRAESKYKSDQQFEEYAKQHSFNERRSAEDIFEDVTKTKMAGDKISDEELRRLKKDYQYIQIRRQSPDFSETRTSYEWVPKKQPATGQTPGGIREENLGPKTPVDKLRSFREIFRGPKTD